METRGERFEGAVALSVVHRLHLYRWWYVTSLFLTPQLLQRRILLHGLQSRLIHINAFRSHIDAYPADYLTINYSR